MIEQAIETAALMLGSDKSRGYCLEMICADFLAGAPRQWQSGDPPQLDLAVLPVLNRPSEAGIFVPDRAEGFMRRASHLSPPEYPANREKYREFAKFCPRNSPRFSLSSVFC